MCSRLAFSVLVSPACHRNIHEKGRCFVGGAASTGAHSWLQPFACRLARCHFGLAGCDGARLLPTCQTARPANACGLAVQYTYQPGVPLRFGTSFTVLSLWHATRLVDPFFHCLECTEPVRRPERMSPSHDAWHAGGTSRNNTCSRAASLRTVGFSGLVRPNGRTPLHICRAACTGLDDECQFSRASPSSRCVAGGRIEATTASRSSGGLD